MDGVDHGTHAGAAAGVSVVFGSSRFLKKIILDYCFSHFDEEQIWLVDSLQVFDPYYLSSVNVSRTRSMLYSIRVSRPFTFYQLHDKIMNLTRIPLDARSTIIISGMDCFIDEARTEKERTAMMGRMIGVLAKLRGEKRCAVLLGVRSNESRQMLSSCFPDMQVWQNPVLYWSDTRSEMMREAAKAGIPSSQTISEYRRGLELI